MDIQIEVRSTKELIMKPEIESYIAKQEGGCKMVVEDDGILGEGR